MNNEPGNISAAEKEVKKAAALLALVGLIVALLDPFVDPAIFAAAGRIIFTDSEELQRIAIVLGIDFKELQADIHNYLNARGFRYDKENYH